MSKRFLTYNKQMKYLRDEKNIVCSGTDDKIILCRNGYFNLINGYKTPFVNHVDSNGKHYYYPDTSVEKIALVKNFDESLKMLLLQYITKAEEEVRTFSGYKFDQINYESGNKWFDVASYDNFCNPVQSIVSMISKSYSEVSKSELEYVKFYLEKHSEIPTWIYVKVINFSTFISFINCCKNSIKDSLCQLYNIFDSKGRYSYKLLIGALHWMRKVRNACAHNERIYCLVRKGGRIKETYIESMPSKTYTKEREQRILDLLIYLKYFLHHVDYECMIKEIKSMLINLQEVLTKNVFDKIRASMGIKNLSDLDDLLFVKNIKKYNRF